MGRRVYGFIFLPIVLLEAAWLLLAGLANAWHWRWSAGVGQLLSG